MTLITVIQMKKMKERTKMSDLIVGHFSWTVVNLLLAWVLYFHDFRIMENSLLGVNTSQAVNNQFGIYQPSPVSLLELQQNNLSNAETYLKPCQTSKMECFAKHFQQAAVSGNVFKSRYWKIMKMISRSSIKKSTWKTWEIC